MRLELEAYRRTLVDELKRPRTEVAVQTDFIGASSFALQRLDEYIRSCAGVVHLVGKATGPRPGPGEVRDLLRRYPDFSHRLAPLGPVLERSDPRISYTQWEAYLALYHGRPLLAYVAEDLDSDDFRCPRNPGFTSNPAEAELQTAHRDRLVGLRVVPGELRDPDQLRRQVRRDLDAIRALGRAKAEVRVDPKDVAESKPLEPGTLPTLISRLASLDPAHLPLAEAPTTERLRAALAHPSVAGSEDLVKRVEASTAGFEPDPVWQAWVKAAFPALFVPEAAHQGQTASEAPPNRKKAKVPRTRKLK